MDIATADLAPIRELYARGLYVQALERAKAFGPFKEWSNAAARLLAGRLVIQLGAPRLGRWLHLRAYRDTPTYHEAIYYHARYRLEKHGPYGCWQFLRRNPEWNDAPPEVRADWYGLHGFVAARLRDFDRAERFLNRAESQAHDRAWLSIERASAYEFAERFDDALQAAKHSQELIPWFRPGVQATAHLLQVQGRENEALDHLTEAVQHIESGIVVAQLAAIQLDMGRTGDARTSYERYAELSPLMEQEVSDWLAARRCDSAYFMGDIAAAKVQAPLADDEFYTDFAVRLELPHDAPGNSVRLTMPEFPVSPTPPRPLTILTRFWNAPDIKLPDEKPTFDGLWESEERQSARTAGFHEREFTITPELAFAMLDRGIPFLMTMVDAGYTHSQVVCGYDRQRNSIWMRDPSGRRSIESPLKPLLERYAPFGPRGLAIVPEEKKHLFDSFVIGDPDQALYDQLHQLQECLAVNDRPKAGWLLTQMQEHRLKDFARLALARYDANSTLLLQALDRVLDQWPDESTFLLSRINVLRDLGRKDERLAMARRQLRRTDGDPLFAQHYAQLILPDARFQREGVHVMQRGIRKRPYAAVAYYFLANLLWEEHEFHEATDLYRFAACLDERDEQFAEAYFRAARVLEQTPEAMRFLQTRFNRTKGKLASPARALFYSLSEQDEMQSAFKVLDQVTEATDAGGDRTETGEVLLFAAELRADYNESQKGIELLEKAKERTALPAWLRTAARMATLRCDLPLAKRHWEELLIVEPLAADAYRAMPRLIADLQGRDAAVVWLRQWADKHPTHHPLQQLLIDWLRSEAPGPVGVSSDFSAEQILRRLIDQCPEDAWAHREYALHLANNGRAAEAFAELEIAHDLEPDSASYLYTLGHVSLKADKPAESREAYEEAIRRSVENDVAIAELVALAGEEDKEDALQFIADELKTQPVFSDGLMAFRDQAVNIMEPDDLLRILQGLLDDHAEVWACWSTVSQQLLICGRLEEAHELAKEAVIRFPLQARLWIDLAEVHRAQSDTEGQIEALRRAVGVAPGWSYAARELAEALESNLQSEDARVVLEQAVARSSLDPVNHGYLADNLWNSGDSTEALERLRVALKLDPGYDWAWRALSDWTERMECPENAVEITREVANVRPGDARAWLSLVRVLPGREQAEEALESLDRAIALNPRSIEAYDLKAERLAEMGRYDEAKAAALPEIFDADPPMVLQGRAAWVEARRGRFDIACREMQALVALEPHYYWGWQQLAEWYNETGKSDLYLEAAEKLVDLRGDSPVALAMRGEARMQTGDRDGGKADLREAQRIAPGYSFAGMLLFDAYLHDEEYGSARAALALLQEHIGGSGRPFVAARYAQLASHEKDRDAALDAVRDACSLPCDSTWPINAAVAECRKADWSDDVDAVLCDVILNSEEFHPYTLFAWLEGPDGANASIDRKLELIDRQIAVHPRYVQTYDVKAEMLARASRYDEALEACEPPAYGDIMPMILRGRAAWIHGLRGDRDTAIARMRDILNADPDYYWGWQQIANWFDSAEAHADYLEAAENLVRLAPADPAAYGYRGEAKLFAGDRRGAKSDFQRAYELDPNYAFAGLHLMDELLADDEIDTATRTLARLQEHIGGPYVRLRAIRLAVKNRDLETAQDQFAQLCRDEDSPYLLLNKAADALAEAGWGPEVDVMLNIAVDDEGSVSHVGRLWVERSIARNDPDFERRLPLIFDRGEIGQEALLAAIETLGKPSSAGRLHECIAQHEKVLRETDRGWAKTARALLSVNDLQVARAWVDDWSSRTDAEPWMLLPAALVFRSLNEMDEAYRISLQALTQAPDPTTPEHQVFVAIEDALVGKTGDAALLLRDIDPEDLDDVPRLLFHFAESLIEVQRAGEDQKQTVFRVMRAKVEEAIATYAPKTGHDDLSRCYRRWTARIARNAGGLGGWGWGLWKKFKPSV